jgi:hypothetical protein
MKHPLLLLLLVAVAGCRMDMTRGDDAAIDAYVAERKAEIAASEVKIAIQAARLDSLRAASRRSAAYADSVTGNPSATPNSSAAKVAAVMAANDITLPQVAAYLNTYGYDVVSRTNTLRPHWKAAPSGRDTNGNPVPVAYYVVNMRVAVGDTTMPIYVPTAVGPVWMRVVAYDGFGNSGPWSETTVSGAGAILPGVSE